MVALNWNLSHPIKIELEEGAFALPKKYIREKRMTWREKSNFFI